MYGDRVGIMWPDSCWITTEQPSSNNEASTSLAWFAICLSFPWSLPKMWSEGHLINPLSSSGNFRANPEHKIANLNSISPLSIPNRAHTAAAIAAPWENPKIPSNGPSWKNISFKYANDASSPSVCCWYWRASNGQSAIFQSVSLLWLKLGDTNQANFFLQWRDGGGGAFSGEGDAQFWCDSVTPGW